MLSILLQRRAAAVALTPATALFARFVSVSAAVAIAGAMVACSKPPPVVEDVRPVRVMTVTPVNGSAVAEFAGEVRPRVESKMGFLVAGRITARRVELGQSVRPGQVLATIDAADYRLSAEASQQALLAARVDRDQQRLDYTRFQELNRQGFISGSDLERRKATLDAAEAKFEQAEAQAGVSGNQANYATLRASAAGVVTAIDAEVGQVVTAGQSVVRVAQTSEKEVVVSLPENRLAQLRQIPEVTVNLWSGGKTRGRVREISPIADAATRTFTARIQMIDPPPQVALGMSATVTFEAGLPRPIVAVPLQALLKEGDGTYVWLLDRTAMTVERSRVDVANVSGNDIVVGAGVAAGDQVVTAGVHLLKDGQKVKLLETLASATPPPAPEPFKADDKKPTP